MQTKEKLEKFYNDNDPWGYRTNPDDIKRKEEILKFIGDRKYENAIDIGCGEGFITEDLPAKNIYGYELSDKASLRLPKNVTRVTDADIFDREYDLVVCTGVLYKQYDYKRVIDLIKKIANKDIVIGGIESWLMPFDHGKITRTVNFPYRNYRQELKFFTLDETTS